MSIIDNIKQFITKHNLIHHNDRIIIGLSGGPDSVFLLHLLLTLQKEYNLTLIAAHLNHEWRPESNQEEELCRSLAEKNNICFVSEKLSQLSCSIKFNGSKEEYARTMRRFFLEKVAQENNATKIALGHHAQDQQETFFIRLIRGSSLTGLTAMNAQKDLYIRPLLETNKKDILHWLAQHAIEYATDASNESPLYLRNRIRATVLPALRACDDRFDDNFLKTINRLKETEQYLEKTARTALTTISDAHNGTTTINTSALNLIDTALHHRVIIQWLVAEGVSFPTTQTFLDEILRFLLSQHGGTHAIHPEWSIVKKHNRAYIQRKL